MAAPRKKRLSLDDEEAEGDAALWCGLPLRAVAAGACVASVVFVLPFMAWIGVWFRNTWQGGSAGEGVKGGLASVAFPRVPEGLRCDSGRMNDGDVETLGELVCPAFRRGSRRECMPREGVVLDDCDHTWAHTMKDARWEMVGWEGGKGWNTDQWGPEAETFEIDFGHIHGRALVVPIGYSSKFVTGVIKPAQERAGFVLPKIRRNHSGGKYSEEDFVPFRMAGPGGGNSFAYHVDRAVGFERAPYAALRFIAFDELKEHLSDHITDDVARRVREPSRAPEWRVDAVKEGKEPPFPATAKGRRVERLVKFARDRFRNDTHMLVELIAQPARALRDRALMPTAEGRSLFWRYVRDVTQKVPGHDDGDFVRQALEAVDMQVFDWIVGNDHRTAGQITRVDDDAGFLLFGNNTAAGMQLEPNPPLRLVDRTWASPHLYLGVFGCRFRNQTVEKLRSIKGQLATKAGDLAERSPGMGRQGGAIVLLENLLAQHLENNLASLLDHVDSCIEKFTSPLVLVDTPEHASLRMRREIEQDKREAEAIALERAERALAIERDPHPEETREQGRKDWQNAHRAAPGLASWMGNNAVQKAYEMGKGRGIPGRGGALGGLLGRLRGDHRKVGGGDKARAGPEEPFRPRINPKDDPELDPYIRGIHRQVSDVEGLSLEVESRGAEQAAAMPYEEEARARHRHGHRASRLPEAGPTELGG